MYSAELWTVGTLKKGPIKKKKNVQVSSQQLTQAHQVSDQPTGKTKREFQYHFASSFILNVYI